MPSSAVSIPVLTGEQQERFWSSLSAPTDSGCREWLKGRTPDGYGKVKISGKTFRVHRVAYWLHYGCLSADRLVCHTCDNPACGNPEHLFLGTDKENQRDKWAKGRDNRSGPRISREKIREEEVLAIRRSAEKKPLLAARYGLSLQQIKNIKRGTSWGHLAWCT